MYLNQGDYKHMGVKAKESKWYGKPSAVKSDISDISLQMIKKCPLYMKTLQ